jgi:hypothetical protein
MNNKFSRKMFICSAVIIFPACFLNTEPAFASSRTERYQELIDAGEQQNVPGASQEEEIVRPAVEYTAKDFRDPFKKYYLESKPVVDDTQSLSEAEQKAAEFINTLHVQGIILGGRFPQAIVNDNVIRVGDAIGEARVVGITKAGVSLFLHNRTYNISSPAGGGPDSSG